MLIIAVEGKVQSFEESTIHTDVPLLSLLVCAVERSQTILFPATVTIVVGSQGITATAREHLLPVAFARNVVNRDNTPGGTRLEEIYP